MAINDRCPFCGHDGKTQYKISHEARSGEKYLFHECNECFCYYFSERFTTCDIIDHLQVSDTNMVNFSHDELVREINKNNYLVRLLKQITKVRGASLDIGAYLGGFTKNMEQIGFEAYGIEPQVNAVDFAQKNGIRVFEGLFPEQLPEELEHISYAAISFLESICYVEDVKAALLKAYKLLQSGGFLIIQTIMGSSKHYTADGRSFFERFGDFVQVVPTYRSVLYWLDQSGFKVVRQEELPVKVVNCYYKRSTGLPIINKLMGDVLNSIYNIKTRDLEDADKVIIIAKKI